MASLLLVSAWAAAPATPAAAAPSPGPALVEMGADSTLACWLETSLNRVYPTSPAGNRQHLALIAARNSRVSFQACLQYRSTRLSQIIGCSVDAPEGLEVSVRRVGYVPMWDFTGGVPVEELDGVGHVPGLVPDPLFPESKVTAGPQANQSFWITVKVGRDVEPGAKQLTVHLKPAGAKAEAKLVVNLEVSPVVLQPRHDFPVTHWWNADGLFDYYKTGRFDDKWFEVAEPYLADMVAHGTDTIFIPLFHHRREVVERPAQLLRVTNPQPGVYRFDWSKVERFVKLAKRCGFHYFEWPHLSHMNIKRDGTILGAAEAQRVYIEKDGRLELLVPADYPPTGEKYAEFLKQFLPELERFIAQEQILDRSWFHVSDEPPGREADLKNYQAVRELMDKLAPWTKGRVIDAMGSDAYGKVQLIDYPVPNVQVASYFIEKNIPHWVYYCCGPRGPYLNRFLDTPLTKVRMAGWLFYHLQAKGFLHWGYNFWYVMDLGFNPVPQKLVDPFTDARGRNEPYGDPWVVYPGADGKPIDSIRWEVFAESLQDYALLQTIGLSANDPLFAELKDYGNFPKNEQWLDAAVRRVLTARAK